MALAWLHMLFGLFFVPSDGRAKSAQQLKMMVLLFLPLYFSWQPSKKSLKCRPFGLLKSRTYKSLPFILPISALIQYFARPLIQPSCTVGWANKDLKHFQLSTRDFQGTFMDYYSAPRPQRSCFAHPNLYAEANFKAQLNSESPRCIIKGKKYSF